MKFFPELRIAILRFSWNWKRSRIANTILSHKDNAGGIIAVLDFRVHCRWSVRGESLVRGQMWLCRARSEKASALLLFLWKLKRPEMAQCPAHCPMAEKGSQLSPTVDSTGQPKTDRHLWAERWCTVLRLVAFWPYIRQGKPAEGRNGDSHDIWSPNRWRRSGAWRSSGYHTLERILQLGHTLEGAMSLKALGGWLSHRESCRLLEIQQWC